ncbi:MAG TPA: branched-chain amino acid ABC transporter substrate-binding protein, partial [Gemmataceae bacterium]|nr:branched-chain amino acid ABC transporter substrate-binding protein [Gemmataceae bacterium]
MDRRRFLAVAAGSVAEASGFVAQKKDTLKIVSSLPRTGSAKGQTDAIVDGIRLAIDDDKGEVAGFKIEYTDFDDATPASGQWEAPVEAANAQKAARDRDVMAFIGPYNSGAAKVSMPILNEAGLLQISPACTWPGLTKKTDGDPDAPDVYRPTKKITFCRVCPHDATQAPLSAEFVAKELKVKSIYVLDDKELYGQGVATLFKKTCEEFKIQVLGHESINTTQADFKQLMTKVKGQNPELVYFGGTTQSKGPQVLKDLRAAGFKGPVMFPDGCYEEAFLKTTDKQDQVNVYVTIGGIDPSALTGR